MATCLEKNFGHFQVSILHKKNITIEISFYGKINISIICITHVLVICVPTVLTLTKF
jgi:hypothetical protein